MLDGSVIVKVVELVVPDEGTHPVPVHPVHECLLSDDTVAGELDHTVMERPASTQQLLGEGEPQGDVTVR